MIFGEEVEQDKINRLIEKQSKEADVLSEKIIEMEVDEWLGSRKRLGMMVGERYYLNEADIKEKTVKFQTRSNTKLDNAFVRKLVDQKAGYLLGKPLTVVTDEVTEGKIYQDLLNKVFDKSFLSVLKTAGIESINKGIGWLQAYFDDEGKLRFKMIPAEEIIPLWKDSAHTQLEAVIRVYKVQMYTNKGKEFVEKVEYWDRTGARFYVKNGELSKNVGFPTSLHPDVLRGAENSHFVVADEDGETGYNWNRPPFIAIKYNHVEQPLLALIKSLVDDYNLQASKDSDLVADIAQFIYVLKNFGGADLGEFLEDLNDYMAVKVESDGGVEKLQADPNTQAVDNILLRQKKNIYEFGRGMSNEQIQSGGNSTNLQIKALFADLDMDMNIFETELQLAFENILYFVCTALGLAGKGDFSENKVTVIFNRDIIMNESESINDCKNSVGILSNETILANHPYVTDVEDEIEKIEKEKGYGLVETDSVDKDENGNGNETEESRDGVE